MKQTLLLSLTNTFWNQTQLNFPNTAQIMSILIFNLIAANQALVNSNNVISIAKSVCDDNTELYGLVF